MVLGVVVFVIFLIWALSGLGPASRGRKPPGDEGRT
jgi:hypothetical protein